MKRLLPASSGIPPNGASSSAPSLQGKADRTAVDARVLADVSQGTHPREPSVQARVMPRSPARITARPWGPS